MKTIEIDTSQNVTIEYELANFGARFLAFFIDFMILCGLSIFFLIAFMVLFASTRTDEFYIYAWYMTIPIFACYTLYSEILLDGQTLGKKAIGLKVVKINGDAPTGHDYFIRWLFRMIDIYMSFGAIASLLISSSTRAQRLGCLFSGTVVIRLSSSRRIPLQNVLKISDISNYTPVFPNVVEYAENDLLFIKRVLDRQRRYPNEAHSKALTDLADQLAKDLEIADNQRPKSLSEAQRFLSTLIDDYVVLTR